MPFHTFAYYTASDSTTADTDTNIITDGVTPVNNNHYFPQEERALLWAAAMAATLTSAKLSSPSLIQIGQQYIRPIVAAAVPAGNDNVYMPFPGTIRFKPNEELKLLLTDSAGSVAAVGILSVASTMGGPYTVQPFPGVGAGPGSGVPGGLQPVPAGPIYWLHGTGTATLAAGTWKSVPITWDTQLPMGVYSVVDVDFVSTHCQAGRLTFQGQYDRPGSIGLPSKTTRKDNRFYDGRFGEWGRFNTAVLPLVEMLASAGDTAEDVYVRCVKVA